MITLLHTEANLTKTITKTPSGYSKVPYDRAYIFNATVVDDIRDLGALSDLLTVLEGFPSHCVIRGVPIGKTMGIRRTLREDERGNPPTLRANPQGVQWVMLDIDKLPVASLGLNSNQERLDYLVSLLPAAFHDVSYHYQWSSSAGLNGWDELSCHLWFWLSEPWMCESLHYRFFEGDYADSGVDEAPFTPNQIHYTASPIFTNCADPLAGIRSGLVRRSADEAVLTAFERPLPPPYSPHAPSLSVSDRLQERLDAIGPRYHGPILKAAAYWASKHPVNADPSEFRMQLAQAISSAPPGKNAKRDYLAGDYLKRVIGGAQRKFGRPA